MQLTEAIIYLLIHCMYAVVQGVEKVKVRTMRPHSKLRRCDGSRYSAMILATVVMTVALIPAAAMATEYTVGDATGWDFAPTSSYYADWAATRKFLPGDMLVFKYLPSAHNVQEVSEADFLVCNGVNPIAEYESGNDIITLPKPGQRFYICGFLGHCDQGGMKLKATIVNPSTPIGINSSSPTPTISPELPSPMTSIIPQLPGGDNPGPHRGQHEHGHGHGAPTPAPAPISIPGGHSRATPSVVPLRIVPLLLLLGIITTSIFW